MSDADAAKSSRLIRHATWLVCIGYLVGWFVLYGGWMVIAMLAIVFVELALQLPLPVTILLTFSVVVLLAIILRIQVRKHVAQGLRLAAVVAVLFLPSIGAGLAPVTQELRLRIGLRLTLPDVPGERIVDWEDRQLHMDSSRGPWIEARLAAPSTEREVLQTYGEGFARKGRWQPCWSREVQPLPTCWKRGVGSVRISNLLGREGETYWSVHYAPRI